LKKILISLLIIIVVMSFAIGCDNQNDQEEQENLVNNENQAATQNKVFTDEFSSGRTEEDYKEELKALVEADEVGEVQYPERNEVKYPLVPLKKDGEIIGYGSWVSQIIYQHPEDMIAVVTPDAKILKWKPIDANDHHPELRQEEYLQRYYGLTLDKPFDPAVDVISGSTYSSNTFFFELRNILLTFELYGPGQQEEEEEEAQ